MANTDVDVVVIGLGAMGSMALWRLASRGINVMGIEQFEIANDRGSSFGSTRLFRLACFEHPDLGTMAVRARDLWRELEDVSGAEILTQTGGVMIGPPSSELIVGTRRAAAAAGSPVSELTWGELTERFPVHANVDTSHVGLWDASAGVVRPELGITSAVTAARSLGAEVLENTRVTEISETVDGVVVRTADRVIRARSVVVATGPWISKLLHEDALVPMRTIMTWFQSSDGFLGTDKVPVFIRQIQDGRTFWGHGQVDGLPLKVGAPDDSVNLRPTDPDNVDRNVSSADLASAHDVVSSYLSGIDPDPVKARACLITFSPDHQFVLGPRETGSRVILAGGCSGHAFKHASAIGEFLAASALGEPAGPEYAFVAASRFSRVAG